MQNPVLYPNRWLVWTIVFAVIVFIILLYQIRLFVIEMEIFATEQETQSTVMLLSLQQRKLLLRDVFPLYPYFRWGQARAHTYQYTDTKTLKGGEITGSVSSFNALEGASGAIKLFRDMYETKLPKFGWQSDLQIIKNTETDNIWGYVRDDNHIIFSVHTLYTSQAVGESLPQCPCTIEATIFTSGTKKPPPSAAGEQWKSYHAIALGFEFHYPDGWALHEAKQSVSVDDFERDHSLSFTVRMEVQSEKSEYAKLDAARTQCPKDAKSMPRSYVSDTYCLTGRTIELDGDRIIGDEVQVCGARTCNLQVVIRRGDVYYILSPSPTVPTDQVRFTVYSKDDNAILSKIYTSFRFTR